MKKLLLFLILMFPISARAAINEISSYYIDATILKNGSLNVKELIVIDGPFQEFQKNIIYRDSSRIHKELFDFTKDPIYNGTGINNLTIKAKKISSEVDFSTFIEEFEPLEKAYYEEDAKDKNYVEKSITDGKLIKIFYENIDNRIAFFLEYTIQDVVVSHEDVAELYWPFIQKEQESTIDSLKIRVTLPGSTKILKTWVHGDINNNIEKKEEEVLISLKKFSKETALDARIVFDASLVNTTKIKTTKEKAYNQILEIEDIRIKKENENRITKMKQTKILQVCSWLYLFILLLWWIFVYFRFKRENKRKNIPFDETWLKNTKIEHIFYLINHNINLDTFITVILNLIYNKNIEIIESNGDYILSLVNKNNLTKSNEVIIELLFEKIGHNNKVTIKEIEEFSDTSSKTFFAKFENWSRTVRKEIENQNFYEKHGLPIVTSIFFLLILVFLLSASFYFKIYLTVIYFAFLSGIAFFIFSSRINKMSPNGILEYAKCRSLKKYLENLSEEESSNQTLWPKYLILSNIFEQSLTLEKWMKDSVTSKKIRQNIITIGNVRTRLHHAITKNPYFKKS